MRILRMIYGLAIIANVIAIAILVRGFRRGTFLTWEELAVIGFTFASATLWASYFEIRRKYRI